jgi:hypothetical protein
MEAERRKRGDGGDGLFFLGSKVPTRTNRTGRRAPMEPYAPIPDDGPFAASIGMFTSLVADLQGPRAAGLTASELEELLLWLICSSGVCSSIPGMAAFPPDIPASLT